MVFTRPKKVIFYEKPGCAGNGRQKELLIKRPLIEVDDVKLCGFDITKLNALLDINMPAPKDINACLSSDKCEEHNH